MSAHVLTEKLERPAEVILAADRHPPQVISAVEQREDGPTEKITLAAVVGTARPAYAPGRCPFDFIDMTIAAADQTPTDANLEFLPESE